jgi:general secretion pathway protein A
MYNQFFGLQRSPFNLTPDPTLLFLPPQHKEALAGLAYAIINRKGFVVLIGDAGTGKTTLIGRTLQQFQNSRIHSSVILNPTLTANEFLELALLDFGIRDVPASKAQRLIRLQQMLLEDHLAKRVATLVIDEAHKLSPVLLEEIRLLSNFEFSDQKLLQIVLAGQNELGDVLNDNSLRQLKQRIAVRLTIGPLTKGEVEQYVRYRWMKCGGGPGVPFSGGAFEAIANWSQGIPRLINSLCDNALTAAFGADRKAIGAEDILSAAKDLDLKAPVPAAPRLTATAPKPAVRMPGGEILPIRTLGTVAETPAPSFITKLGRKLGLGSLNRQYE